MSKVVTLNVQRISLASLILIASTRKKNITIYFRRWANTYISITAVENNDYCSGAETDENFHSSLDRPKDSDVIQRGRVAASTVPDITLTGT